jgi:uncharacterized protein (TIGR02118 family)
VIKVIGFIRRKDGLSLAEFSDYWLRVHAPLIAAVPGMRRYVQSHLVPEALDRYEPPFDGIALSWFGDVAAWEAAKASDAWRKAVDDAANFIGAGASLIATEVPIIEDGRVARERESMVKYAGLLTRLEGWQIGDFQAHWRDVHGPLVKSEFTTMLRYVQNHPLPETYESSSPPAYDGVPEAWFESLDTLAWSMVRRPEGPRTTVAGQDSATIFRQPIPCMVVRDAVIVDG